MTADIVFLYFRGVGDLDVGGAALEEELVRGVVALLVEVGRLGFEGVVLGVEQALVRRCVEHLGG